MLGKNIKRSPVFGDGKFLEVKNIFYTIQGEGPFTGIPAIFVRLGGCNLACSFCDTDFEDYTQYSVDDILKKVISLLNVNKIYHYSKKLIVITGGEPLRQPIRLLCEKLLENDFVVQIETNGIIGRSLPKEVNIVCSPKIAHREYNMIHELLIDNLIAVKFLVSANLSPYNDIAKIHRCIHSIAFDKEIFVQPIDEYDEIANQNNKKLAVQLCLEYGYRLSYQMHKVFCIE